MKSLGLWVLNLSMLAMLASCGKDNKSGQKSGLYGFNNPYGMNPLSGYVNPGHPGFNSAMLGQFGCVAGGVPSHNNRIPIQIPLTNYPSVVGPGDIYVGVTSDGDVATLTGNGTNSPLFTAYVCSRSFAPSGQGQLMDVKVQPYIAKCPVKTLSASMMLPGGFPLNFRSMDYYMYKPGVPGFQPFPGCNP